MPFAATQMIHDRWSRAHQGVVIGSMNGVCVVTDPARSRPGEYDDTTGTTSAPTPYVVVPDGTPCRVVRVRETYTAQQAGQDITARQYRVTLPAHAPGAIEVGQGMAVRVTGTRDPATATAVTGLTLTVVERLRGTEEFDLVLMCEHNDE